MAGCGGPGRVLRMRDGLDRAALFPLGIPVQGEYIGSNFIRLSKANGLSGRFTTRWIRSLIFGVRGPWYA